MERGENIPFTFFLCGPPVDFFLLEKVFKSKPGPFEDEVLEVNAE